MFFLVFSPFFSQVGGSCLVLYFCPRWGFNIENPCFYMTSTFSVDRYSVFLLFVNFWLCPNFDHFSPVSAPSLCSFAVHDSCLSWHLAPCRHAALTFWSKKSREMSWLCPHRLDFESALLHWDENLHNSACGIEWWCIFNDFFYAQSISYIQVSLVCNQIWQSWLWDREPRRHRVGRRVKTKDCPPISSACRWRGAWRTSGELRAMRSGKHNGAWQRSAGDRGRSTQAEMWLGERVELKFWGHFFKPHGRLRKSSDLPATQNTQAWVLVLLAS